MHKKGARFSIDCADAVMLLWGLERLAEHNYGNGVSDVRVEESPKLGKFLVFSSERYAMDGLGTHVGYEEFTAALPIHDYLGGTKSSCPVPFNTMGLCESVTGYVIPSEMQIGSIVPADETPEHTPEEAREYLKEYYNVSPTLLFGKKWTNDEIDEMDDDDVLELAFDHNLGEGDYYPPDEDFAYQELEHYLNAAIDSVYATFAMDGRGRRWEIWFEGGDEPHKTYWEATRTTMYKNFLPPEDDDPQEGSDDIPLPIEIELAGESDE